MPGNLEVKTCPKCGALITPQLERCRQCGTYLHGTAVEGFLVTLLPRNLRAYPATGVLMGILLLIHVLLVVLAGAGSVGGFSSLSLNQFGAMFAPGFLLGEWWRPITAVFLHAGPVHILFNLWALSVAGRYTEQIYDAKKMLLIFVVAGVVGGLLSLGYKMYLRHDYVAGSVGASGAICGLIGATMVGARKMGPEGRPLFQEMIRWLVILVVFGFLAPGIDNAGHVGGFLVGAGFAMLVPIGMTQTVARQKILSVLALGTIAGVLATFGYVGYQVRGEPLSVAHDAEPQRILWFTLRQGERWADSGQRVLMEQCTQPVQRSLLAKLSPEEKKAFSWEKLQDMNLFVYRVLLTGVQVSRADVRRCEVALRANPGYRIAYEMLAACYEKVGEADKAKVLAGLVDKLFRARP